MYKYTGNIVLIFLTSVLLLSCSRGYKPPAKNEILNDSSYKWTKDSSEHFDFYFESNSMSSRYVDSARIIFESKYTELLKLIDIQDYENRLTLFMIDSREKMKQITGMETNGIAFVEDKTVFSVFNDKVRTFGIHEFCHIISIDEWGKPEGQWLSEGLAVYADSKWWGYELHPLAHYLSEKGKLIPLRELTGDFYKAKSYISYPECGSLVKFIREKYGLELIKELWKQGTIAFEKFLHKNLVTIEKEWLDELSSYEYSDIDYEKKISDTTGNKIDL